MLFGQSLELFRPQIDNVSHYRNSIHTNPRPPVPIGKMTVTVSLPFADSRIHVSRITVRRVESPERSMIYLPYSAITVPGEVNTVASRNVDGLGPAATKLLDTVSTWSLPYLRWEAELWWLLQLLQSSAIHHRNKSRRWPIHNRNRWLWPLPVSDLNHCFIFW